MPLQRFPPAPACAQHLLPVEALTMTCGLIEQGHALSSMHRPRSMWHHISNTQLWVCTAMPQIEGRGGMACKTVHSHCRMVCHVHGVRTMATRRACNPTNRFGARSTTGTAHGQSCMSGTNSDTKSHTQIGQLGAEGSTAASSWHKRAKAEPCTSATRNEMQYKHNGMICRCSI